MQRCSAFLLAVAAASAGLPSASAQLLPAHSITVPGDAYALDANWFMAGSVVPTGSSIVLSPGIPNRIGALWSKTPLLTNDFELTLKLKARRPAKRGSKDGGFAFWFTPENGTIPHERLFADHAQMQQHIVANTWTQAFENAGFNLLGYKNKYDGLGVFFVESESPTISALANDGQKDLKLGADVPAADALKFDFLIDSEVSVKVHVQPTTAKIEVEGHGSIEVKHSFKTMGFMGFTSVAGTKLPEEGDQAPFWELKSIALVNNDKNSKGEETVAVLSSPEPTKQEDKVDALAEASSHKDHREESDAIKDLTNVVFKLVMETQPVRHQMERAIQSLATRIDMMETAFSELKAELDKKTGHKLGAEFEAIKKELTTLSSVASKETQDRGSKLESLHADIADVHKSAHSPDNIDKHLDKLSQSNTKVLDQLTNEHQRMFGFSIAAIAFVVIAGLSLYNKFRCWEKKHVL